MLERGSLALINGRVFTSNEEQPVATAVGIERGVIAYVGDDAALARAAAGEDAEVIDLQGRMATAGLIDAHAHPIFYGGSLANVDIQTGVTEVADILARVQERVRTTPEGELIGGWGYYTLGIAEGRPPLRWELDSVAPDHPVVLRDRSGHELAANSLALQLAGITRDSLDPEGGRIERDEHGEPNGILIENAMAAVSQVTEAAETLERAEVNLRRAIDSFLSFGITSVGEALLSSPQIFQLYQRIQAEADTPRVRFNLMLDHWQMLEPIEKMGLMSGFGDRWLRAGAIKFFIDGTEGQRTAKVSEGFADQPGNTGMWMFAPEVFRERIQRAHVAGWQCAVHAIGDAAVELTLDAYAAAQRELPRPDIRHRVEHASLLRPDLIQRFADEPVIPVPGARFASNDYPVLIEAFGAERMRWYQPWNALLERNVPVAISSDAPVQSPDPARNLWAIVNSRSEFDRDVVMQPDERITLAETLLAYTRNGAFASHEERFKGCLTPGYLGDVTVFDRDLAALDVLELDQAQVDLTIVDGCVAYRRGVI
jgi:hypothetical protein